MVLVVEHTLVIVSRPPRRGLGHIGPTAPNIDDGLALNGDRHRRTDVLAAIERLAQQVTEPRIFRGQRSRNLGHHEVLPVPQVKDESASGIETWNGRG